MRYHFHDHKGVIALLTVIVIGAVMLSLGISTALSSHVQVIVAGQSALSNDTRELVSACIEEAVHRLKKDPAYVGGTVPLDTRTCTITVVGAGSPRTITATATVDDYTKTIVATIATRNNTAASASGWAITSWSESDPP